MRNVKYHLSCSLYMMIKMENGYINWNFCTITMNCTVNHILYIYVRKQVHIHEKVSY